MPMSRLSSAASRSNFSCDAIRPIEQDALALFGADALPAARFECLARAGNGTIDVGRLAIGYSGDCRAIDRRDDGKCFAGHRAAKLAVDNGLHGRDRQFFRVGDLPLLALEHRVFSGDRCIPSASEAKDRLDHFAAKRIGDCFVDAGEGIESHEAIDREFSLHEKIDQLRQENIGIRVTLDDAADGAATGQNVFDVERKFEAFGRAADHAECAARRQKRDGIAQYAGIGRRIHDEVDSQRRDTTDCLQRRLVL